MLIVDDSKRLIAVLRLDFPERPPRCVADLRNGYLDARKQFNVGFKRIASAAASRLLLLRLPDSGRREAGHS